MDILWHAMLPKFARKHGLDKASVFLAHADFLDMKTLNPFSHVYMFDKGFPPQLMEHIAQVFHSSEASRYIMCFKKPKHMLSYGFDVELVGKMTTKMCGSGEGNTCFFYKKSILASSASEEEHKQLSWEVPAPPAAASVAAPVAPSERYGNEGLELAQGASVEAYRDWLHDQVGTSRATRNTRSSRRRSRK